MKLSGKMTLRFAGYFLAFYAMLVVVSLLILFYIFAEIVTGFSAFGDIREVDTDAIGSHIDRNKAGEYSFSASLEKIAQRSGGELELLDRQGNVLLSSSSSTIAPVSYSFSDLIEMSGDKRFHTWLLEDEVYLLFKENTESEAIMDSLRNTVIFPQLDEAGQRLLEENNAIFELYDREGNVLDSINGEGTPLTGVDLLVSARRFSEHREMITSIQLDDGITAVVRMPNRYYTPLDSLFSDFFMRMLIGFAIFHGVLLLFIVGYSLWIGRRLGRPVFYFLKRIERLSKKDYSLLDDKKLRNAKDGRLKRKYRMYDDVDQSLITLASSLEANERKLKKTEQLREDWVTGLSHDLKTPLSSIYGYSVILGSNHEWTSEDVQKFASVMQEKAGYMDELINDLTYTYQLKSDGVVLEREHVELGDYVRGYVERNSLEELHIHEPSESISVFIDQKRFGRVLDNVIGNAVKHNPTRTPIYIHMTLDTESVQLQVRDEGVGMSADVLENLFDRYYRGTNTTSDGSGSGLGMTIAKQLVEAHGGWIRAKSDYSGTTITISLPKV
ncbi:HAMP domain-containing sensor histidine kinase [Sporosarcina sp. FSL K6-1522]|uniref:sensor histidine kinase n=1 Tax=Sporosarcina sp. FSL K6-1522 TaxID=2921554 RepID=UPI00315A515F